MNLYKIDLYFHCNNKQSIRVTIKYVLARNDEQVYDYIEKNYENNNWSKKAKDQLLENRDKETYKEKIVRLQGQKNDSAFVNSLMWLGYTNILLYGWELIQENVNDYYNEMVVLGEFDICK